MNQPLPDFLAAQRPQSTINYNRTCCNDSLSWTAGRCQRLLRPIASRIELLRNDLVRYPAAGNPHSIRTRATSGTISGNLFPEILKESLEGDACWIRGRKRVRRTYSARSKLQDVPYTDQIRADPKHERGAQDRKARLQPGELQVPTPILSRTKPIPEGSSHLLLSDFDLMVPLSSKTAKRPRSGHVMRNGEAQFGIAETMRRINKTTDPARSKVYQGIYNSLEALLKATALHEEHELRSKCGTNRREINTSFPTSEVPRSRSLFSMCLRGVPNHIKEEEKRFANEAGLMGQRSAFDTRIISTETYAYLESLGISEAGYKHLKTVVRRHGVLVISDAIKEGLLDADITGALVMLCVRAAFPSEAETLVAALLKASGYPDPKSPQSNFCDAPALMPLLTLGKLVKHTGHICYFHRHVTEIIASGSLSITWLGTKQFASIWTSLFRSLSVDAMDRDATTFMATVLPLICRGHSSSLAKYEHSFSDQTSMLSILDTTLASVLTTLLAMGMLSTSHRNISQILRTTIVDCQLVSSEAHSHGAALFTMANLLGSIEVGHDSSFVRQLVNFLGSKPCQSFNSSHPDDCIPAFVCSVARCCGRGSSGNGFEHLQVILQRLIAFASLGDSEGTRILKQIVVDSASNFAGHLPHPEHLQYAQLIRTCMHGSIIQPQASLSKGEPSLKTGFRWEEGINEWVMATPAARSRGDQGKEVLVVDKTFNRDTPISFGQKRRNCDTATREGGKAPANRHGRISDLARDSPKEEHEGIYSYLQHDYRRRYELARTHHPTGALPKLSQLRYKRRSIPQIDKPGFDPVVSSQNCAFFEDSDDELNSASPANSHWARDPLHEISNSITQKAISSFGKRLGRRGICLEEQSEDELGLGL